MTRHVSEDTIIRLALGLLDARAEGRVRRHLAGCSACQEQLSDIERSVNQIREVSPHVRVEMPPLPSSGRTRYGWLRVAAVLAAGIGLGFAVSESLHSPSFDVVAQQIIPRTPERPPNGFVACDEVDLTWNGH